MNEGHQRFHEWLTGGAEGDPPRDVAVHASVCPGCGQAMDALDLLAMTNTGLAGMPARPTGREHSPLVMVGRLAGATAVLFSAAILGVGVSQLVGLSPGGGPVAKASHTPEQSVLAQTATPLPTETENAPTPSQALAEETLTPLGTPAPTHAPPAATPIPWRPPPTPLPTAPPTAPPPTPVPTDSDTPLPSASPTPVPTTTPVPTPPTDMDGDGVTDADELMYGSDPNSNLSTPENSTYAAATCTDTLDNDLDGFADALDTGGCP